MDDDFLLNCPTERQVGQLDEIAGILDSFAMEGNRLAEMFVPLFAQAGPTHRQRLIQRFMVDVAALSGLFTEYEGAWHKMPRLSADGRPIFGEVP